MSKFVYSMTPLVFCSTEVTSSSMPCHVISCPPCNVLCRSEYLPFAICLSVQFATHSFELHSILKLLIYTPPPPILSYLTRHHVVLLSLLQAEAGFIGHALNEILTVTQGWDEMSDASYEQLSSKKGIYVHFSEQLFYFL